MAYTKINNNNENILYASTINIHVLLSFPKTSYPQGHWDPLHSAGTSGHSGSGECVGVILLLSVQRGGPPQITSTNDDCWNPESGQDTKDGVDDVVVFTNVLTTLSVTRESMVLALTKSIFLVSKRLF